jgi:hypothetical protein
LRKLRELRDAGLLTQHEYEMKRADITPPLLHNRANPLFHNTAKVSIATVFCRAVSFTR